MALAFNAANVALASAATSLTFAHTNAGSNLILSVGAGIETATDAVSGATYAGVAMTQITKRQNTAGNEWLYAFYLIAPATGANNVVITSGTSTDIRGTSHSLTGALQLGQPDSFNSSKVDSATTIATSTTVVAADCWLVSIVHSANGAPSVNANVTQRANNNTQAIGDSNGVVVTGSRSQTWNLGATGSGAMIIYSIAPAPAAASGIRGFIESNGLIRT